MSAYTNRSFIESEGSWGIHNWDYAKTVILKAIEQAKSVRYQPDGHHDRRLAGPVLDPEADHLRPAPP